MKQINDFYVGESAEITHAFYGKDVDAFAQLSTDINPLHTNEEYAKSHKFGKRIVHGFLTGSLISAVLGNILPGEGSIYMSQTMSFRKPVFLGDIITARVTIKEILADKHQIRIETECLNQDKKIVITGEALMYYPE